MRSTDRTRRAGKSRTPDTDDLNPTAASGHQVDLESDELSPEIEDFSELFGDGSTEFQVRIIRRHPKYHQNQRIGGYLGVLPPDADIEYIRQRFGGGVYSVQQYAGSPGKYVQSKTVQIAGLPRVVPPSTEQSSTARIETDPPATTERGKPVPEDADFFRQMRQLMLERAILRSMEPPSINDVILEALLNKTAVPREAVDPLEAAAKAAENIERLREVFATDAPSGDGGNDLLGLLNKALDFAGKVAIAKGPRVPLPPRPNPPAIAAPPGTEAEPASAIGKPITAEEGQPVNQLQIAQQAVSVIVQAYLEEPPYTVEDTVTVIRQIVPDSDQVKEGIRSNRSALYKMALLSYHAEIEPDAEADEKFRLFFDSVFDSFLTPTATLNSEGGTS